MREFAHNLSWSSVGFLFNAITLFGVNILAARLLGPDGYGKYNLILVSANLLSTVVLLGMQTVVAKFVSESENESEKSIFMSNALRIVTANNIILSLVLAVAFLSGSTYLANGGLLFVTSVFAFAIFLSYKSVFESIARGFGLFKTQSMLKIAESLAVCMAFFLFFYVLHYESVYSYIAALVFGMFIFCVYLYRKLSRFMVPWNTPYFQKTIRYSRNTILLLMIMTFMSYADRLYVGRFLGMRELGIYSAYLTSSTVFIGQIMLMLNNVFFPTVVSMKDKQLVRHQLDRVALYAFFPIFLLLFAVSYVVIGFFGEGFEKSIILVAIFSFLAFLQLFGSLYLSLLSAQDVSYEKYREFLFVLPVILMALYGFLIVFNRNSLLSAVFVYSVYVIYNFTIIRLSCNYEKK